MSEPDIEKKTPFYGALSIVLPIGGFLLCCIAGMFGLLRGWAVLAVPFLIMPFAFLCGLLCVLLAFARNETWRILPILGIVVNVGPVIWFLIKMK